MKRSDKKSTQLRQAAEAQLAHQPNLKAARPAEELLHELEVHQVELEMQNEHLRQSQIELEKSRDRYAAFYDFAPVGYLTLDHQGMIEEINLTGAALLKLERNKLKRRRFAAFISPADRDRWHHHFRNVLTRDDALSCELALQHGDQPRAYIRLDSLRVKNEGQEPSVRSVLTDITARKQVEEQLRWYEEGFRLMVESVVDYAIVMLDTEGRVMSWNSGAQRIMGYSAEEIIGQHYSRFYQPEDINLGTPQRELELVAAQGRLEDEGWRVRKDGSTFWAVEVFTAFQDHDGNLRGFAKLTRDMTGHKLLDQILLDKNSELEKAKLVAEKANLAKSEFLSSMSHELRSPLNAILGFAQLLEAGSPPPTDIQALRLTQIIKAGWYLLELINEILDLAVIESGKLSLMREAVRLSEIMRECQAMIETQAQQHGIQLIFPLFDDTWFVKGDQTRIKQVLINLLSNAIKYNREQGTVEVKCSANAERIRISIKDCGAGLPAEKLEQLFQPFNRLGQEGGSEEGTGIGLVVTKQLVEKMGGAIGVESTVGVGSEFWIELHRDVMPCADNAMPEQLAPPANTPPCTLLYVEDNPANLLLVEQIIEGHPQVRMLSAHDGDHGIELACIHRPDVILMDINLPGISGTQALKVLREDPVTARIPVIALSANAMPRDIEKGLEAGFFRYITKPIKINEFMSALEDALKFSGGGRLFLLSGTGGESDARVEAEWSYRSKALPPP